MFEWTADSSYKVYVSLNEREFPYHSYNKYPLNLFEGLWLVTFDDIDCQSVIIFAFYYTLICIFLKKQLVFRRYESVSFGWNFPSIKRQWQSSKLWNLFSDKSKYHNIVYCILITTTTFSLHINLKIGDIIVLYKNIGFGKLSPFSSEVWI